MAKAKPKAKIPRRKKTPAKKPAKKPARKPAAESAAKKLSKAKKIAKPAPAKRPAGIPEKLRDAALKVLDERKAEEVVVVDLTGKSSVADYMIVASGHAARQMAAIAHYLQEAFVKLGAGRIRIEGLSQGNWVLVDAGDIIVHLFRPEVRRYYNLETLWETGTADVGRTNLLIE